MEYTALLDRPTPRAADLPAEIEALNIAAFDVCIEIQNLSDLAGRREELASAEATAETNADKRKVRRAEILRDDVEFNRLREDIRERERIKVQLTERSHRYAREFRLIEASERSKGL